MTTKIITSFSLTREQHQMKQKARQNVIEPHSERVKPKYFCGYLLQKDQAGYFILKTQPDSATMIREDLPHSVGYAAALERDTP